MEKFAVITIGGHQYLVKEKQEIVIEKLKDLKTGQNFDIKNVLLVKDGENLAIGKPILENFLIKAENLGEIKGKKKIIFKMKPKKKYMKTQGHRQKHWKIKILTIEKTK